MVDPLVAGIIKDLHGVAQLSLPGQLAHAQEVVVDTLAQDVLHHDVRLRFGSAVELFHFLRVLQSHQVLHYNTVADDPGTWNIGMGTVWPLTS